MVPLFRPMYQPLMSAAAAWVGERRGKDGTRKKGKKKKKKERKSFHHHPMHLLCLGAELLNMSLDRWRGRAKRKGGAGGRRGGEEKKRRGESPAVRRDPYVLPLTSSWLRHRTQ